MDALRSRLSTFGAQTLIAFVLVAMAGLVGRLVYINAYQGPRLLARAERQQRSIVPLKHRRGLIVDCRGRIIAGTLLRKSVFADPMVLPDKEAAAQSAAQILGVNVAEIAPDLLSASKERFMVLAHGVTEEQAEQIKHADIHGLGLFEEPYRTYPMDDVAAQLIGFVSPDGAGVSGLEYQCESWLRGDNGLKTIVRDARRKAFWLADGGYRPPRDGLHVVLTIDSDLQATVERELAKAVEQFKAQSAVGIVMHPGSGAILAMANVPGFNPNRYQDYGADRYRNRAITDPYEPGSTFKPFVAAAALAEKVVRLGEVFDCERGAWADGSRVLHDHHPYGALSFEQVLIKSSNIGMAKIGKRLGNKRIHTYLKAMGFGSKSGVDLVGEDPGMLLPLNRWTSFSTTSLPIGQEISVTPLQMARAFCVFANGGLLVKPYIVRAVMAPDGRVVTDFSNSEPQERVLPETIANTMKNKILRAVVESGTGSKCRLARYDVFGKTGTAQIARKGGGGYLKDAYVSSFVAAAPSRDPQLVVIVTVTKPTKSIGYYGGTVAAPVAREILSHALAYLQVPPDRADAQVLSSSVLTDAGPAD
jgi:cell division protein FtsI/penicillin-binding protein 2